MAWPQGTRDDDRRVTIQEFYGIPDDGYRMELVRGKVVREPPAGGEHGRIELNVGYRLRRYLEREPVGVAFGAETGFILSEDERTVRAPDAAFVRRERIPPPGVPTGYFPGPPDLAVEVVSPSNTPAQIREKVNDYVDAGTRLVWVVHPRSRTVTVHHSRENIGTLERSDTLDGGDLLPGFHLPVEDIFDG